MIRAIESLLFRPLLRFLFLRGRKIVIASNGRAGSTMLFEAIADAFVSQKCGLDLQSRPGKILREICFDFVPRLQDIRKSRAKIIKTHDLWEQSCADVALYIFVHGDPLEAALSVEQMTDEYGKQWFRQHQYNLRGQGEVADLYQQDVLNYRQQLTSWLQANHANVLTLAYEELWSRRDDISGFVGFDVALPQKRARREKTLPKSLNKALFDDLSRLRTDLKMDNQS